MVDRSVALFSDDPGSRPCLQSLNISLFRRTHSLMELQHKYQCKLRIHGSSASLPSKRFNEVQLLWRIGDCESVHDANL